MGLDVPQASIAVAVVEADGVERPLGLIPNRPDAPRGRRALVPRLTALRQGLAAFLHEYDHDRAHNGCCTQGLASAEVLGAAKLWPSRPAR